MIGRVRIDGLNAVRMARGVSVDVTLKDKTGAILATVRDRIQSIDPNATYHYAVTKTVTGGRVASIAVKAEAASFLFLSTPVMHHVTLESIRHEVRTDGTYLFATVKNGYDCPISGLTVHYQYLAESKKPLGGGNAWLLERLEAGAEKEISAHIAVPVSNIAEVAYSVDFDALILVADEGETT